MLNKASISLLFFVYIQGELKKHIDDVVFPKMLGHLEKLLSKNKEGKGWFVGDKVR